LSNEQQEYNNSLAEEYNQEGYFPLVVVLNNQGDIIGKTGYKKFDPNKYIELLNSF
jgi:RimJ/RimL family protein N-acetyltransferase